MHTNFKILSALFMFVLMTGCVAESDISADEPDDGNVVSRDLTFALNLSGATSAGVSVSSAIVTISGNLVEQTLTVAVEGDTASVSFPSIPVGGYDIQVRLYDGDTLVAEGAGTAQVYQNSQSSVSILVNPVTGNLEVGICIPAIGEQYLNADIEGVLTHNQQTMLTGLSQPAPQRYLNAVGSTSEAVIAYRIGNAEIPAGGETSILTDSFIDHGASFRISSEGSELLALSGCNTRVALSRTADTLSILFMMPETYEASIPVTLANLTLGSIEMNGLTMMIQLVDTNGDTGLANATHLADLDFSKFDDRMVSLGVPLVTGLSGMAGTLITSYTALIDEGFYLSRLE